MPIPFLKNWTIDISKIPQYSAFRGKFSLKLDYVILRNIMTSNNPIFTDNRKQLLLPVLNKINKQTSILEVIHNPRYGLGRFYPDESISPICVSRHIKHTLFAYLDWIDLDMVKGHPTMLYCVAQKNGVDLPTFKHYLENFDSIVETLSTFYSVDGEEPLTRDNIKELFSILVYGGGFSTWIKKLQENSIEIKTDTKHDFVESFHNECKTIMSIVYLNNPALVQKIRGELVDEYKIKQRTISYFCGTIENEILFLSYKVLLKYGVITPKSFALEYDGICCKRPSSDIDLNMVVVEMNQTILSKTGFKIEMKWKDYSPIYIHTEIIQQRNQIANAEPINAIQVVETEANDVEVEDDTSENVVQNDNDAGELFFNRVKDILFACNGSLYLKDNHIWICDIGIITNKMIDLIMSSKVIKVAENGKTIQYSQNIASAKHILETLFIKIKIKNDRPDLYMKFHTTTTNYVCFEDGVLDFKNKRFILWEDIDFEYYSTVMIKRPFQQSFLNPNEDHIQEVLEKILGPLFKQDIPKTLHFLARAISGNYLDKNWFKYQGNRNCGKAVFELLEKLAFGDYIQTISTSHFACQRVTSGEDARNFEWASVLEFARIGIAQEASEVDDDKGKGKINGNLIKKICSGGDVHKYRKIYQSTVSFIIEAFLMFFGNNYGDITPKDTLELCLELSSVFQYKSQEFIDNEIAKGVDTRIIETYLVGDPNVKKKAGESIEWANALVHIMLRSWQDKAITIIRDADEEELNVRSIILNGYDIVAGDKTKFTPTEEILDYLKKNKMEIGAKKLKPELDSLGCEAGRKTVAKVKISGYYGISEKEFEEEEE